MVNQTAAWRNTNKMARRSEFPADEFMARFRSRVPYPIAATFSPEQLIALQAAFGERGSPRHGLRWRVTLHLPWGRYYQVLMAGRDRRTPNALPAAALARVLGQDRAR